MGSKEHGRSSMMLGAGNARLRSLHTIILRDGPYHKLTWMAGPGPLPHLWRPFDRHVCSTSYKFSTGARRYVRSSSPPPWRGPREAVSPEFG
jgi:hypothetical protein